MKFAFIYIVIFISCSVCDCDDLDLFSGPNFNYEKRENAPRLPDYNHPSFYSKFGYPFDILQDDYEDPKLKNLPEYEFMPDKVRQFQEVIDWQRSRLQKHRTHDENPSLQYYLDQLSNNPENEPERFELGIPMEPRLAERGIYLPEDDSEFRLEDDKENLEDILRDPLFKNNLLPPERLIPNQVLSRKHKEDEFLRSHGHGHHRAHSDDGEFLGFASNRFKNAKVVDNPSDFAYGPSDSRFYRKIVETTEKTTDTTTAKVKPTHPEIVPNEKPVVSSRSDQTFPENDRLIQTDSNQKDGGIEMVPVQPNLTDVDSAGVYIIAIVAGISAAATVGLIAVGIGWYNLQKHVKNASDVEYPAYGVTGPNKDISPSGDRRLAQSAQMYHYQHQKQQIIAMERAPPGERHGSVSEADSDEENEEGDYTVYECPGLAPTGEMEVKNPLFQDDPTPAQTPAAKVNGVEKK